MSSRSSTYKQVPVRGKYYIVLDSTDGTAPELNDFKAALDFAPNVTFDGTIVNCPTESDFQTYWDNFYYTVATVYSGSVYKDMGKSIYLKCKGEDRVIYRLVQRVLGAQTEGVPPNYANASTGGSPYQDDGKFYVVIWSWDMSYDYPYVARTG